MSQSSEQSSEKIESLRPRRGHLVAALGIAALLVPAAAGAKPDKTHKGNRHCGRALAGYVFKGTYNGDGSVHVRKGNRRVRKAGFVGDDVEFDFSGATYFVADIDDNGDGDLLDVQTGDKVVVRARLPKRSPGSQPFSARRLVDRSHPEGEELEPPQDDELDESEPDEEIEPEEPDDPQDEIVEEEPSE
jgi:hypothetical protein